MSKVDVQKSRGTTSFREMGMLVGMYCGRPKAAIRELFHGRPFPKQVHHRATRVGGQGNTRASRLRSEYAAPQIQL